MIGCVLLVQIEWECLLIGCVLLVQIEGECLLIGCMLLVQIERECFREGGANGEGMVCIHQVVLEEKDATIAHLRVSSFQSPS